MQQNSNSENIDVSLFDHLTEGFQLIDFNWRYKYVNDAVISQSKFSQKSDMLGFTVMEKFPDIEKTELFTAMQDCMIRRVSATVENEFYFPDDSSAIFKLIIEPVPDGVFIISFDITGFKQTERLKREYYKNLEDLLVNSSHKLRTPIAQITGMANLLENANVSPEELSRMLGFMRDSAQMLDKYTRQLTAFTDGVKKREEDRVS